MRRRLLALLSVAALGGVALSVPAEADHAWGNYHWARTANPFTLQLGDNVSSVWDSYLTDASSDWSDSSVLDTRVVPGNGGKRCAAATGHIEVCNSKYGNNGWLGIASIWASGDHITRATTKLNDTYFNTAKYNKPEWRAMVMCQEIGHDFGLGHQDENFSNTNLGSCMDYTNDPLSNQHPNAHDYALLESIYSHTDSTSTVAASSASSGAEIGNDPSSWGREVARSQDGRTSTFERDLGNDERVITHVTWADDATGQARGGRDH